MWITFPKDWDKRLARQFGQFLLVVLLIGGLFGGGIVWAIYHFILHKPG